MKKITLFLLITTFLFSCTTTKKPASKLVVLSNGKIEIGILPDAGAALVRASLVGKKNILQSDSTLWNELPGQRASLDPKAPFKSYNGHITWLSPQSEWWINQDSLPELKKAHANWPPDPLLTVAPYRIISQTSGEITLVSPESKFSKVQFTKIYRIDGNTVTLTTRARNFSKDTVSWGLWHNTRMNGWDAVFVQADSVALLKTQYMKQDDVRKPELNFDKGFYTYNSVFPESPQKVYKSKSFFNVEKPLIAGYHHQQWLIIRGDAFDPAQVHPNESRVELYIENSLYPEGDLQELEIQFAYRKIAPGASIEASETWEIFPGSGITDKQQLLDELQKKLK